MEREHPHHPEGGEHHHETHEANDIPPAPIFEQLTDEQRIQRGIADALNEGRTIDDRIAGLIAQHIAEQVEAQDNSALHSLAATGSLSENVERELLESVQDLPPARDGWIDALLDYADGRGEDREPRQDWAEVTDDDPEQAIEAARATASRERRADRARLERYVELGLDPGDAEALIEFEHLSAAQRAEWAGIAEPSTDKTETTASTGQPVTAGKASEDEVTESATSPERDKRLQPRIFVRCLAAYNNSILHGQWIDADQDEEALWHVVEAMLNASPVPGAEEFAIHDYEGFTGYPLGEYENLAFISRLAQGIVEHGQAFAAYAEWIGRGDAELEHFTDHHEGTYPTREAWAEEVADEIFEWPRWREAIPEILRTHVRLDLTDLALTLEQYRHIVEGSEGVYVFNPDA